MKINCLLIGQGISGTFLSHELQKAGLSFLVIDEPDKYTASRIASGIINPVTGRRVVTTWMIDELMPFAWEAYKSIGKALGIDCITQITNMDFFPSPQMRLAFLDRIAENSPYLSLPADSYDRYSLLQYDFGYGIIDPCYLVNLQELLLAFRNSLLRSGLLREDRFEVEKLVIHTNSIQYQDIEADRIVFCDGIAGQYNPWFKNLPFAPNKGEVLIVEIPDLPPLNIYKKGISIVPWKDNLFWAGSSHEWKFENQEPSAIFRQKTEAQLQSFLKVPFTIMDHWAAVRPATLERRPFAGFHPQQKQIGIFNGMGTKGCSLAPFFARQLAEHLTGQGAIQPDVNIDRFRKVLSR